MTCKSSSEQTCNPRGIHLMIVKLFILKHLGLVSYGGIRRFFVMKVCWCRYKYILIMIIKSRKCLEINLKTLGSYSTSSYNSFVHLCLRLFETFIL